MKRLIFLIMLLGATNVFAQSYHQFGYVKTKGYKDKVGDRVEGVRIKVKGQNGAYRTDARGEFSMDGLDKKFILES